MVEKTYSYRTSDEKYIEYLNKYWDGSFSRYVNNSFKRDTQITKSNKTKDLLIKNLSAVLLVSIGAILVIFSMYLTSLFIRIGSLFLGSFLIIYGILLVYLEVVGLWKTL